MRDFPIIAQAPCDQWSALFILNVNCHYCTVIIASIASSLLPPMHRHHRHHCTVIIATTAPSSSPPLHRHHRHHCTVIIATTAPPVSPQLLFRYQLRLIITRKSHVNLKIFDNNKFKSSVLQIGNALCAAVWLLTIFAINLYSLL